MVGSEGGICEELVALGMHRSKSESPVFEQLHRSKIEECKRTVTKAQALVQQSKRLAQQTHDIRELQRELVDEMRQARRTLLERRAKSKWPHSETAQTQLPVRASPTFLAALVTESCRVAEVWIHGQGPALQQPFRDVAAISVLLTPVAKLS